MIEGFVNETTSRITDAVAIEEARGPFWHSIFWVSPLFTGAYCLLFFTIFAIPVCLFSHDTENYFVNEDYHVSLFQGKYWPKQMRTYFKIKPTKTDILLNKSVVRE